MATIPRDIAREMVTTLASDTVTFAGAKLHLLKAAPSLTPTTVWSDLTEADFSGYAGSASITWGAAINDPLGNGLAFGDTHTFMASDTVTTNTIYGWALTTGAATPVLLEAGLFSAPIPIARSGDAIVITPAIGVPATPDPLVYGP